jgi:hypothetical protein
MMAVAFIVALVGAYGAPRFVEKELRDDKSPLVPGAIFAIGVVVFLAVFLALIFCFQSSAEGEPKPLNPSATAPAASRYSPRSAAGSFDQDQGAMTRGCNDCAVGPDRLLGTDANPGSTAPTVGGTASLGR